MCVRALLLALAALLLPCSPAATQEPSLSLQAGETPRDFDIRGRDGALIRVSHQKLLAPGTPDRADICFAVSSLLAPGKTFVMNQAPVYIYDGSNPGPECRGLLTDFDYDSYDMARDRRRNMGARADAYGRRAPNPKGWAVQMAFYADAAMTKRIDVTSTEQLTDALNLDSGAREFFLPLAAGWRTTLFWLRD